MRALKNHGGQRVGPGHYWDPVEGDSVHLRSEGTLPGDAQTTYYRMPALLLLIVAPLFGLAYVLFLPFIGLAMVGSAVAKKLFGGAAEGLSKAIAFGWRPAEAYLAGAEEEEDKESDTDTEGADDASEEDQA